jgi:TRAP-type mannitol/chloroaromatic compound transport system substrate-binding protein
MPGGELYEAMQRGTIDAFEYSTLASNWTMHFNEVADYVYISSSRAPSDPQVFFVNKDAFNALPADLQAIVKNVVSNYTMLQHEYLIAESIKAVESFKKAGNKVLKVPADIEKAIMAEADKFYSEKAASEKPIFGEIYNSMKAYGIAYAAMQ